MRREVKGRKGGEGKQRVDIGEEGSRGKVRRRGETEGGHR